MAAKTLARRVAEETEVQLGQFVGYKTGYDKCYSNESKILFCTDGLQMVRSLFESENEKERVLVIDEVHEWNLNMETLHAWCKFMKNRWNTKVVIMSATLDTAELVAYFGDEETAVISVPGTTFEVEVEEREKNALIGSIVENVRNGKNILVFVPGKKEITDVISELADEKAICLPLHAELEWSEQKKCFEKYPYPKVVVATNVAQTSITIPDIDVVVDTGTARFLSLKMVFKICF